MASYSASIVEQTTTTISVEVVVTGVTYFDKIVQDTIQVYNGQAVRRRTNFTGTWDVGTGEKVTVTTHQNGSWYSGNNNAVTVTLYNGSTVVWTSDVMFAKIGGYTDGPRVVVANNNHDAVEICVENLLYFTTRYGDFVTEWRQNGTFLMSNTLSVAYEQNYFFMPFTASPTGNNWFAPNTTYTLKVSAYYGGTLYDVGTVTFSTETISQPSGAISPSVYPTVKDQGSTDTCVANAITAMMEVTHAKAMGRTASYENYSIGYFYGGDGRTTEGMVTDNAVSQACSQASPRWELVETEYPRQLSKSDAKALWQGASSTARANAIEQWYDSYEALDFYDCESVASNIRSYGSVLLDIKMPSNISSIPANGILPQPTNWRGTNHAVILIGLTTINGKKHWIGQNSWGTSWGASGLFYIPYDWGCGIMGARAGTGTHGRTAWVNRVYVLKRSSVDTNHPTTPTITAAIRSADGRSAEIHFSDPTGGGVYIYVRAKNTTPWFPKPSFGSAFSSSPASVSLDSATTEYQVSAIAKNYSTILSLRSAVADITDAGPEGGARIYNGGWGAYDPYIYTGSRWAKHKGYIYEGGWKT